jgi:TolB protein
MAFALTAAAASPSGPRLAFVGITERPGAISISTSDAGLGAPATLALGNIRTRPIPYPHSGPSWAPDGSLIAFSGMTGPIAKASRPQSRQLYLIEADGDGLRPIPHTRGVFGPVFSPDGKTIAFAKTIRKLSPPSGPFGRSAWWGTTAWSVRLDGSALTQLTEWRNGVQDFPSSFSPDGSTLGLTHRDVFRDRADAVAQRLGGRGSYLLAEDAGWPRYSPDGSQIAFLGIRRVGDTLCCELGDGFSVDLYAMNANRTARRRLTDTPAKAERPASWDPSGERLAYTTKSEPTERTSGDLAGSIMEINADGSCQSRISAIRPRGKGTFFYFPTWQPGPGRGAGRIVC